MKGKTLRQIVREGGSEEYVLVTHELDHPIYIGELDKYLKITLTNDLTLAKRWGRLDASHEGKLSFHRIVTGYKELKFEKLDS